MLHHGTFASIPNKAFLKTANSYNNHLLEPIKTVAKLPLIVTI